MKYKDNIERTDSEKIMGDHIAQRIKEDLDSKKDFAVKLVEDC